MCLFHNYQIVQVWLFLCYYSLFGYWFGCGWCFICVVLIIFVLLVIVLFYLWHFLLFCVLYDIVAFGIICWLAGWIWLVISVICVVLDVWCGIYGCLCWFVLDFVWWMLALLVSGLPLLVGGFELCMLNLAVLDDLFCLWLFGLALWFGCCDFGGFGLCG